MPVDLSWDPAHTAPAVVLMTAAVAYTAYHYALAADALAPRMSGDTDDARHIRAIHAKRLGGAVVLGVIPAIIAATVLGLSPMRLGLSAPNFAITGAWVGGTIVVALPVVAMSCRNPSQWVAYPEIRAKRWDGPLYRTNALTWAVYLLGYELFFRGFLIEGLIPSFGVWPAIATSTALYVFAHLGKPAPETIGTILMGVVFAVAALTSGGIWAPFGMHLAIAMTSDIAVTRANPAITVT